MIIAQISIIIVALVSCGSKHREPQDDGKIIQKSNDKIPSHRLWFSIEAGSSDNNYKLIYEGRESVMSFAIVNPNSIPAEAQNEYSKVELLGLWKRIKYQLFSLNLFNASSIPYSAKKSEFHPEYLTITSTKFFFDIPKSIDLSLISSIKITLLDKGKTLILHSEDNDFTRKLSARKLSKQKRILKVHGSTPSEESLDLVVLGDGFSAKEMDISSDEALLASKFGEAVKKNVLGILDDEPWKFLKDHINIWVVATPSKDSEVSLPYKNVFKETTFSTALTCSGSPYVLEEGLALEAASEVPFDDVLMLVNSDSYGGISSNFLSAVNLSENAKDIILHELGHDRGFLADEYLRFFPEEENDRTPSSIESEGPLMLKLTDTREPYEEFINTLQSIWAWDTNHFSQGRMQINRNLASTGRCNPKHKQIVLHHDLQRNRPNTSKIDLDSEEPPMANLTISTDRHTGKWSKHLSEDAPTINFDYPTKALSWNKEKKLLKGVFKLQESREDLLILIGFLPKTNQLLTSQIKSVTINKDNEYLFSKESVPSGKFKGEIITTANQKEGLTFSFTSLPNVHLQEGASVEISIKFREDLSILLPERISQTTFLSLPSGVFKGQETGFFQGAHLSSKKVWRPNYCSKMNRSSSCPFFPVHIEKIKEMILHYLAPLQTQEDAS